MLRPPLIPYRHFTSVHCALWLTLLIVAMAGRAQAQEVIEYYGTDVLGSIRVVFDANGNVISRADYLPFGEELATTGPMPAEHFTGQARDGEAGMDYLHARQYQPRTGRFNAVDAIYAGLFDPQQWNRYAYARNNPLRFVDPTGLLAEGPRNFCGAEFDFRKCGGEDLFWDTGGGGGFEFGGDYARALDQGYVPGMPADIWAGLQSFNQGVDDAVLAAFYRDAPTETIVGTSASLPRALQLAGQVITRLTPAAQRALDGLLRLMNRSKEFETARQALPNAQPTGQALKDDIYHRAAAFMQQAAAYGGSYFANVGGDGKPYTLIQYLGKLNNISGRYEYSSMPLGSLRIRCL